MKKLIPLIICVFMILCFSAIGETVEVVTQTVPVAIDLTQIIISIIGLFVSFVLTWVVRAIVPPVKAWLEARTTAEQRSMIYTLIKQLVNAAEQRIGAGLGSEKREFVAAELRRRGFDVDFYLIESAVKEMNDNLIAEFMTDINGHTDETDD